MKRAEIEVGKAYRAEIGWRQFGKVIVRETGVMRRDGQHRAMADGVRVELAENVKADGYMRRRTGEEFKYRVGDELVVTSRKVQREWTPADDEARAAAEREVKRKAEIERRLGVAGYAEKLFADDDEAAFHWRGADLVLSPALTAELLDLAGI